MKKSFSNVIFIVQNKDKGVIILICYWLRSSVSVLLCLKPFYRAHTTQVQSDNKSDLAQEDQAPPFLYIFKKVRHLTILSILVKLLILCDRPRWFCP